MVGMYTVSQLVLAVPTPYSLLPTPCCTPPRTITPYHSSGEIKKAWPASTPSALSVTIPPASTWKTSSPSPTTRLPPPCSSVTTRPAPTTSSASSSASTSPTTPSRRTST